MNRLKFLYPAVCGALVVLMVSCGSGRRPVQDNAMNDYISKTQSTGRVVELITAVSPTLKDDFRQGGIVPISYKRADESETLDSVVLFLRGTRMGKMEGTWEYRIGENDLVGRMPYRVIAYQGKDSTIRVGEFAVKAAEAPQQYGFRVKNTYPHDKGAYTQGLYWHDGYLYESTGQKGESSMRKVDLKTGEVLEIHELEEEYFGEGCAFLDGKIFQLTWQNQKGFIYDPETLKPVGEFGYPGEGWGLTTDGEHLYMSNGTEKILVIDPTTFRTLRTIEVYTDESRIMMVNELEWIEGEIWANVYTTDMVIRIDPETGVVKGVIDLKRILPAADKDLSTDVLNGIAYDPEGRRIFVTGKMWKKLFEIELVKK